MLQEAPSKALRIYLYKQIYRYTIDGEVSCNSATGNCGCDGKFFAIEKHGLDIYTYLRLTHSRQHVRPPSRTRVRETARDTAWTDDAVTRATAVC